MIRISYIILSALLFISSCTKKQEVDNPQAKKVVTSYGNNIVVLTDLSNRIDSKKSVHDTTILGIVVKNMKGLIQNSLQYNIKDRLKIRSINVFPTDQFRESHKEVYFDINLDQFTNELALSNYLFHDKSGDNYDGHITKIQKSVNQLYEYTQANNIVGADMYEFLKDDLQSNLIDLKSDTISAFGAPFVKAYKNKVIILTDGYIEAGRYGDDPGMVSKNNPNELKYLSGSVIKRFRLTYNNSDYTNVQEFYKAEKWGITPVSNQYLSKSEILIMEIDDRSIVKGMSTVSPSDGEIIKLFWSDWLTKSGIPQGNFKIYDTAKSQQEAEHRIKEFLEVK